MLFYIKFTLPYKIFHLIKYLQDYFSNPDISSYTRIIASRTKIPTPYTINIE